MDMDMDTTMARGLLMLSPLLWLSLRLMLTTAMWDMVMATIWDMAMVTMATQESTMVLDMDMDMDTTMARGLLMLSPLLWLSLRLMLTTAMWDMVMATIWDMAMATMATQESTMVLDMDMDMDMPTVDTMATPVSTVATMDTIINLLIFV